jgi:hypothetical protein
MIPTTAYADDIGYQFETSVASGYIARGIVQYASQRDASSQNTALVRLDHVGSGSLSFVLWNAVALSEYDAQPGTGLELDLSVAYAAAVGPLAVTAGYTAYLYPDHASGTPFDSAHELWGTASYDNAYVVPTVAMYAEVARQQGVYLSIAGGRDVRYHAWTFGPNLSLGGASYRKYLGADQPAGPHFNDVTGTLGARLDLGGGVYATAKLCYAFRGTPSELMPDHMGWGFDGRSSLFAVLAVGVAR